MKNWGRRKHSCPINSGRELSRCYLATRVAAGLGPTVAACSKAFSGCSKPGRAGEICPKNIPVPPPAGDAWPAGKNKVSGSRCGERSYPNWTRAGWIGKKVFWMPVSLQLKKGLRSWKNKRGKGTKWRVVVDGSGVPLGSQLASARPGGSEPKPKAPWTESQCRRSADVPENVPCA